MHMIRNVVDRTLVQTLSSDWFPTSTVDCCDIAFAYSRGGIANDKSQVPYWTSPPDEFKNRYLSTCGGGFAINRATRYAPSGIIAGAVSGQTNGGFGSFATNFNKVFLLANGTANWQAVRMHGYQAYHELALIAKEFAGNLYKVPDDEEIYKIMNPTIEACDVLDRKSDGVVSQTDLFAVRGADGRIREWELGTGPWEDYGRQGAELWGIRSSGGSFRQPHLAGLIGSVLGPPPSRFGLVRLPLGAYGGGFR
ncbi:hypothetical protein FALCPG4_016934 [Fusarium falciforme]